MVAQAAQSTVSVQDFRGVDLLLVIDQNIGSIFFNLPQTAEGRLRVTGMGTDWAELIPLPGKAGLVQSLLTCNYKLITKKA
jgi:hypothetical protein